MNNKLLEALKALLPEDKVEVISTSITESLEEAKSEIEKDYQSKLDEAYATMEKEIQNGVKVAETGYQEAYSMINDLRNRLELQKAEYEKAQNEGYEEAYQMLLQERAAKEQLEVELYAEYDSKFNEAKELIIDKVDEFLKFKGKEIAEQVRRDIINDPRMAEHRVALGKIIDVVSDYITDEEAVAATSNKLEEARKVIEQLEIQKRVVEARNIKLSTENTKLNENVRNLNEQVSAKQNVLTESRKERAEKAANVQGRGKIELDNVEVITESSNKKNDVTPETDEFKEIRVLAGVSKSTK